jgi:hypothetical protein
MWSTGFRLSWKNNRKKKEGQLEQYSQVLTFCKTISIADYWDDHYWGYQILHTSHYSDAD